MCSLNNKLLMALNTYNNTHVPHLTRSTNRTLVSTSTSARVTVHSIDAGATMFAGTFVDVNNSFGIQLVLFLAPYQLLLRVS